MQPTIKLSDVFKVLERDFTDTEDLEISGISNLKEAGPSQLSYAISEKHVEEIKNCRAAAILLPEKLREYVAGGVLAIPVDEPELFMARVSRLFGIRIELPDEGSRNIDPTAVVFPNVSMGSGVVIGKNSCIMPGVYLGDHVVVGDDTTIHPNCVVYRYCQVGSRCIIHGNTVIGSDGFGYAHTRDGEHVKIEQLGNVIIEDDVEIGSNTSIDRATFSSTIIRKGSKIDNLVHISHNVEIGEHTIIAGQTGIAGSTKLGRNVVMAAQSGAAGHITIADFTTVAARGGVSKNTEPGKTYAGFPMMDHKEWLRFQGKLVRLVKKSS